MEYKMKKHIVMASLVLLSSTSAHSAGVGLLSMILGDKNVNVRYVSDSVSVSDAELYARRDRVLQRTQQQGRGLYFPDGRDTVYEQYIRLDDGRVVRKVITPRGCQVAYTGNMVCLPPEERIYYVKEIPQMPVAPGEPVTVYSTEVHQTVVQAPPKSTRNKHVDPEEIPGKRREEIDGIPIQYGNERVGDSPCVGSAKDCARRIDGIVN